MSSTNASIVLWLKNPLGWTNLMSGVFLFIALVIRSLRFDQLGGDHPVPCPVPWS